MCMYIYTSISRCFSFSHSLSHSLSHSHTILRRPLGGVRARNTKHLQKVHTHICVNTYMFIHVYIYIDICIYIYVFIYSCICIHKYISRSFSFSHSLSHTHSRSHTRHSLKASRKSRTPEHQARAEGTVQKCQAVPRRARI